jgi:hypothetical protein
MRSWRDRRRDRTFGAAEQDVGLDAVAGQLTDAVLGRLGLQLARGGEVGHQRGVDKRRSAAAKVVAKLADCLDEGQAFDVADRAANLANDEVEPGRVGKREFLDRVGDVGNDLDGGAEVVAAPLTGDDALVDAARGYVVRLLGGNAGVALVMAKIEVGSRRRRQ